MPITSNDDDGRHLNGIAELINGQTCECSFRQRRLCDCGDIPLYVMELDAYEATGRNYDGIVRMSEYVIL